MSTASLHIEMKKILVPKLRFQGFEGEWKYIKLGDYIKIKSGNSPSTYNFLDEGVYPFIKVEELNNCNKYQNTSRFYSNENKNLIEKFSVIFPKRGAAILNNKVRINDCPILMDSNMMAIIPLRNKLYYEFLYYKIVKEELYKIADTSTIPQINNKHIEPYRLFIPLLTEQQKIASCLSVVDEKIQQLSRKKELLEQYKKGVMQQLFSGKLRFKDENGKDYADWEEKRLGDVAKRVTRKNKENNLNVLTISAQLGLVSQLEYFNKSVSAKDVTNYYLLERNDFAYNKSYSNGYPMGAIKRLKKYDKGVVSTLYICFCFNERVSLNFMEQYFEFGLHNYEIEKVAQEGARNHGLLNIGVNDFLNIALIIPSIQEQQKIANFLSSIDTKIESTTQQINQTQSFKKGLLQQLFV